MLTALALIACQTGSESPATDVIGVDATSKDTTLFGLSYPVDQQQLLEIDMEGNVVWSHAVPSELQAELSTPEREAVLGDIVLLDDGNILFAMSPGGLFEIDRDGNTVWEHRDDRPSHDVDVLDNGNILFAATWAPKGQSQIVEITRQGEEVWGWTGENAFGTDPTLNGIADEGDAWMHVTSVERDADGITRATIRNFNMVLDIAPDGEVVNRFQFESRANGKYVDTEGDVRGERPHGTDWLNDDSFVTATRRPHRAVQIDDGELTWEYGSDDLGSIRDVDRLDNGHTLIAGRDRIVEVDGDGVLVWQWNVPAASMPSDGHVKPLMAVSRLVDGVSQDRD